MLLISLMVWGLTKFHTTERNWRLLTNIGNGTYTDIILYCDIFINTVIMKCQQKPVIYLQVIS